MTTKLKSIAPEHQAIVHKQVLQAEKEGLYVYTSKKFMKMTYLMTYILKHQRMLKNTIAVVVLGRIFQQLNFLITHRHLPVKLNLSI